MNFLMGQTYGLLFDLIKLDLNKRNKRENMLFHILTCIIYFCNIHIFFICFIKFFFLFCFRIFLLCPMIGRNNFKCIVPLYWYKERPDRGAVRSFEGSINN